ncbi:WD40 repeat-containing protein [Blyttiomyces helicus]|uniref:WD40 repeat-containing protein n=1 Tax=Blyttiomyces helicus TaxID=388810 RepID=A0A4P9WKZ1_9FUNG|nr:WD40 repeat-containing protein [Blyttiomyces helicus]|eukprot:RKO91286.1 WD40 repeat-containing protein [Blyttiomyces helicus]
MTPDLLATTGDYLRIWEMVTPDDGGGQQSQLICRSTLSNVSGAEGKKDFCAPLTSFDWNDSDPNLCVTSSIDTTCTVWDIETQQAKTQLIAHDKEVFDVAFARGRDIFASVGADGSVRMFDLRTLEHSTIIYETPPLTDAPSATSTPATPSTAGSTSTPNAPLLRISWNKQDPNYLATFKMDSRTVLVLDIRVPAIPVSELRGHVGTVNAVGWAPHSSAHICSAGDDGQALVWNISSMSKDKYVQDPVLGYGAGEEINQVTWSGVATDWVAIAAGKRVQALKV